jgi:hypothetical protein
MKVAKPIVESKFKNKERPHDRFSESPNFLPIGHSSSWGIKNWSRLRNVYKSKLKPFIFELPFSFNVPST